MVVQETLLDADGVPEAQSQLASEGWVGLFAPAVRTLDGGLSGGVALLVRQSAAGLRELGSVPDSGILYPGRLLAGWVSLPGGPELLVFSAYLETGQRLTKTSWEVLAALGSALEAHPAPSVVGGDSNVDPEVLQRAGLLPRAGLSVVNPSRLLGTCTKAARPPFWTTSSSLPTWRSLSKGARWTRRPLPNPIG